MLDTFAKQGYVLDKSRLINGQIFDEDYFDHLISEIQEIRASERRFYQKITDIYATVVDYSVDNQITKDFLRRYRAEILQDKGKVTAAIAKTFAESEFEQYRIIQDRLYQSDFDRLVADAQLNQK